MVLLGALLTLLATLIVRPDWPEAGPFGPLAEVPWWVTGAALAGGALFVVALVRASRAVAWWGALPLVLAAGAAGRSALVGEAADTAAATTLLAAGLACLTAAMLAVGLSVARSGWGTARSALTTSRTHHTPRWHVVTAMALPGVLLGGLLGGSVGPGGDHLHEALRGEPRALVDTVHATSDPVDDVFARETPPDSESWASEDGVRADTVSWQETVNGPVELTECEAVPTSEEGRAGYDSGSRELVFVPEDSEQSRTPYSTLVALDGFGGDADQDDTDQDGADQHGADQSVLGLDPATGQELWRYTVHADQPRRIGQVAVGAECDVLVVIDPGFLVALSSLTGEVRGMSLLPPPLREDVRVSPSRDPFDVDHQRQELATAVEEGELWRFPPAENDGREPAGVVRLASSDVAVLAVTNRLMTVRRANAEILSFDERNGSSRCRYLADYDREPVVLSYGCGRPTLHWLGTRLADDRSLAGDGEHLGLEARHWHGETDLEGVLGASAVTVPDLGCWNADRLNWSDGVDFSWMQLGIDVILSGGCVWENIGPDGTDPPEDAGDRIAKVAGPYTRSPRDTYTEPLPDALTSAPTPPFHGGSEPYVVFHVHDGTAYARDEDYHTSTLDSFRDPEGEDIVAVAQPHDSRGSWYTAPVTAVTEEGSVVFHQRSADLEYTGRTDAAREPCDGGRDLRVDRVSETVLVLCTTADSAGDGHRTEITALAEVDGDRHG